MGRGAIAACVGLALRRVAPTAYLRPGGTDLVSADRRAECLQEIYIEDCRQAGLRVIQQGGTNCESVEQWMTLSRRE